MARNCLCEVSDSTEDCEDKEIMLYRKSCLDVITFKIVRDENDIRAALETSLSFKPDMAHQIFGETEMIFGYKQLKIDLYYLHNSAKCYVDIQSDCKIVETKHCKADDIMTALSSWLPTGYKTDKKNFIKEIAAEEHLKMFGEVIHTFSGENRSYMVTACDTKDPEFREFHQRFQTYIIWFIDGANFIDLDDSRWLIYYVYEEFSDETTKKTYRSPIAFCTIYKFFLYPNSIRPRISQFFVLPSHQKRGIGTEFYSIVFDQLKLLPEVGDITVEEPTAIFQQIRDFSDTLMIHKDMEENNVKMPIKTQKHINRFLNKHKICKKQGQRVFDILQYLKAQENGDEEFAKFTESIRNRITEEIERENQGPKKMCKMGRMPIVNNLVEDRETINTKYKNYIDSLKWPVMRLRSHLKKSSV